MRTLISLFVVFASVAGAEEKLSLEDRVDIVRGLTAEYATVRVGLPRSKKPLAVESTGDYDTNTWADIEKVNGPAARTGDQIQITKVTIEGTLISLEINGGIKSGRGFWDRAQIGIGGPGPQVSTNTSQSPIGQSGTPTMGTYMEILFHRPLPSMKSADIKKILAPIMSFDQRSATEYYIETLSPELQAAIKEKRAIEGMNREQVMLAMGRPVNKSRETKDGLELEDWIYGKPPGRITFVTFGGSKVVKVKESYAGLGAEAAAPLPVN